MNLTLVCVGKLKERYWRDAADEYLKRLRPYARVRVLELPDRDALGDERRALAAEGEGIVRALPEGSHVVVFDRLGEACSSEGLAGRLERHAVSGVSSVSFVIGGAGGLDEAVLARADERVSLGAITLPHQLARIVVLEQLYRAFRISRGEPYHR